MNYRYVLQELRHHHHRTLVNILGIAVGIALFVSMHAISAAYQQAVSLPFQNIGADLVVQRPEKRAVDAVRAPAAMQGVRLPFSNQLLPAAEVRRLAALQGVTATASSLLLWEFAPGGFRTIMGVDLAQPSLGPVKVKEWLAEGRFPQQAGEAVLEKHYAKLQHVRPGDSLVIGNRSFAVVGLLAIKEGAQVAAANIYLPMTDAGKLLAADDPSGVNVVYLRLQDPSLQGRVKTQIGAEFPGTSVTSSDSFLELAGGVSRISGQFALLISLIALGGAITLIINSMLTNLVARSREIGILKAVGWTNRDIHKQLLAEALLQSLAGGILGLLIGYAIAYGFAAISIPAATPWQMNLLPAFAKNTETAIAIAVRLPVRISAGLMATALLISLVAGVLASHFMSKRTARMKPVDVLKRL